MKAVATILGTLLVLVHLLRFNLPTYYNTISVFDTLGAFAWIVATILLLLRQKTRILTSLYIFNLIGAFNQFTDELFFDPTRRGPSDYIILGAGTILSLGYILYDWKINQITKRMNGTPNESTSETLVSK